MITNLKVASSIEDLGSETALTVNRELHLIKPALLYADRFDLLSISVIMLRDRTNTANFSEAEKLRIALSVAASSGLWNMGTMTFRATMDHIQFVNRCTAKGLDRLTRVESRGLAYRLSRLKILMVEINKYWETKVFEHVQEILSQSGLDEIDLAIREGVLTIDPLPVEDTNQTSIEFVRRLQDSLGRVDTYPILDEPLIESVNRALAEGHWEARAVVAVSA